MRKFKIIHDISPPSVAIVTQPQSVGHVFLKPHLFQFLCVRENLSIENPLLDLSRSTLICKTLRLLCLNPDTYGKRYHVKLNKKTYSTKLRFVPLPHDAEKMNFLLDEMAIREFNEFLHYFMIELLFDNISEHLNDHNSDHKAQTAIHVFVKKYNLEASDWDWESLKRAEYRLRTRRVA